jgi:hypothetical protein
MTDTGEKILIGIGIGAIAFTGHRWWKKRHHKYMAKGELTNPKKHLSSVESFPALSGMYDKWIMAGVKQYLDCNEDRY